MFSSNGTVLTFYHNYQQVGTYNVSVGDLYNYSNTAEITVNAQQPIGNVMQRFLIVQQAGTSFLYIPINTTNETLATFICRYAPITINSPGYEGQYGDLYGLGVQTAIAKTGYALLQNNTGLSYYEQC